MKNRTRLFSGLAAFGMAAAAMLAVAAPANAAPASTGPVAASSTSAAPLSLSQCGSGDFCLWGGGDYSGWIYSNSGNSYTLPASVDNASDSIYNDGNYDNVNIYQLAHYQGYSKVIYLGDAYPYLGQVPMGGGEHWSDRISSFEWV